MVIKPAWVVTCNVTGMALEGAVVQRCLIYDITTQQILGSEEVHNVEEEAVTRSQRTIYRVLRRNTIQAV